MSKLVKFILQDVSVKLDIHKLKKFNDLGFIILEKIIVNLDGLLPSYIDFYEEMVENETNLANISDTDNILHLGCGSIPATSLIIAKKTKAEITGVDKNYKSVKQAQKLLSKLNLSDRINVMHLDTADFPVEKFDLIIASQGIKPYTETLKHISKSMKNDARLIIRTTSSPDGNLVDADGFIEEIFNINKIVNQKKHGYLISVLCNKKTK
jgi:ubiquinone/menaquinone biosynthesis C-methylase UbiE